MEMNRQYHFSTIEWNSVKLEILENELFTGDCSWNFHGMSSPFNRIYFMIDGDAYLKNDKEFYELLPGHMYLVPAGSRYDYVCTSVIHKYYIHFNLEIFPGNDLFSHFSGIQDLVYAPELLETILAETQKDSLGGILHLKAIFWQIVYDFLRCSAEEIDYVKLYKGFENQKNTLDYLSAHLSAGLRIREIADALEMPIHQLSRSFSRDTGYGLKEYMEQMLLKKARHLLLHTDMSVSEISESLGFTDPFYFSRFFKKYEQIAPREYRRQMF